MEELTSSHPTVIEFRQSLRSMEDEAAKFQACVDMRDKLLDQQTELEYLYVGVEEVMQAECALYKVKKRRWLRDEDADAKLWKRFEGAVTAGAKLKKQCLAPLTKATAAWGIEKVQHYRWAYAGEKYCKVLGTAVIRNPDWADAIIKLNQLILRRCRQKSSVRLSRNAIHLADLEALKLWDGKNNFRKNGSELEYQAISVSSLPPGFSLDRYGLVIMDAPIPAVFTDRGKEIISHGTSMALPTTAHSSNQATTRPPPSMLTTTETPTRAGVHTGTRAKRRRLSSPLPSGAKVLRPNKHSTAAVEINGQDASFREQVLAELNRKKHRRYPRTWGQLNDQTMLTLLDRASQPVLSGTDDEVEAYFLTGEEAETRLQSHTPLYGPIITEDQQQFKWSKGTRPIEQLFQRMGNPNRTVSVQKPSLLLQQPSCVTMRLGDVRDLFLENKISEDPLNVLELRNPLPRAILPYFLTGEDCQLLGRVRDSVLEGTTAERCCAPVTEWNKWKDDEDWILLAQGGAHTLTHQDSCGKATWLTVQEGQMGFGWISRPTEEEKKVWSIDPNGFTGGNPRYVILRPGQTIYFEAGTIHFVFRPIQHQTLIVGGHVLRWSRVASFMEVILNQARNPDATNEDILPLAQVYVGTVAELLSEHRQLGRAEHLCGEEEISRFFELKKEFVELFES